MGSKRDLRIVVVAASAGGVTALQALLSKLQADFPAALLAVLHVPATGGRALPRIMDRVGQLRAAAASDGEQLRAGRVYFAPPDRHMLVVGDRVRLSHGPRQNGHRPAADPLFRSAALAAGPRVLGVVLSGSLDDGAAGCAAVERRGGVVAIQDPKESSYEGMPRAALAMTSRAVVLRVGQIVEFLDEQSRLPVEAAMQPPDHELERYVMLLLHPPPATGTEAGIDCPKCGGPLRSDHEGSASLRYKCGLGHSWSPASFAEGRSAAIQRAVWSAPLRREQRSRLGKELAESAERRRYQTSAAAVSEATEEASNAADAIRALQARGRLPSGADGAVHANTAVAADAAVDVGTGVAADTAVDAGSIVGTGTDADQKDDVGNADDTNDLGHA